MIFKGVVVAIIIIIIIIMFLYWKQKCLVNFPFV